MKRILAIVLALCLLAGTALTAAQAEQAAPASLVIGNLTEMSGYFYTDLWGTNTSDMDVRGLIHAYGTIALEMQGVYAVDETIVTAFETTLDRAGNKTYTFTLANDLRWNNGQPVTVQDYLCTVLLQSSPELAGLGVSNANYSHLVGWKDFAADSASPFTGVRLLSDNSFSLTVQSQYLPYFYELMLVNVIPTPISVVAPGVAVADDGRGAYLATAEPAVFNTDLLRQTLLGANRDGYVYKPTVTTGAFSLESYDAAAHIAQFVRNPYYKGNYEGKLPEMERLTFRPVQKATMLEELKNGTVDILNKVSDGSIIGQGMKMVNDNSARSLTYMRSGFAFLSFACEDQTASQTSVRKAVAMSLNVDALITAVMSGYAMPVYGYYGLGQWMATQDSERLSTLSRYGYDPIGARQLLIADGWIYNESGEAFTEGRDEMRYKIVDDNLTPLELRLAMAEDSVGAQNVTEQLTEAAKTLGAKLAVTHLEFSELLTHYYRQTDRTYNMFLLGTNFTHVYDPYYAFNTGDEYQGVTNTTGLRDEKLMALAQEMRSVANEDVETYLEKWYEFQTYFAEVLPIVPLYSNVYFDFTRPDLYGYQINAHWGWNAAILYATFTEPVVELTAPDAALEATDVVTLP